MSDRCLAQGDVRAAALSGLIPLGIFIKRGALAPRELDRLKLEFLVRIPWLGEELKTMKASRFTEARDRRLS